MNKILVIEKSNKMLDIFMSILVDEINNLNRTRTDDVKVVYSEERTTIDVYTKNGSDHVLGIFGCDANKMDINKIFTVRFDCCYLSWVYTNRDIYHYDKICDMLRRLSINRLDNLYGFRDYIHGIISESKQINIHKQLMNVGEMFSNGIFDGITNFCGPVDVVKVIFNDPATIVLWSDDTKTVVKVREGERFDEEKGFAMAVAKKFLGTNTSHSNYYDIFKKYCPIGCWVKEE